MSGVDCISVSRGVDPDGLRERLVQAAFRVICDPDDPPVRRERIAATALVGGVTFDRVFPGGLEECLEEVNSRLLEKLFRSARGLGFSGSGVPDRVSALSVGLTEVIDEHRALSRFVLARIDGDLALRDRTILRFADLLAEITGLVPEDAKAMVIRCYLLLQQRIIRRQPTRPLIPRMLYLILTAHETSTHAA